MSENVRYEVADHVARITIDRPEKMNAMTDEMYGAMSDAIRAADTDSNVRCVIVTGAGDRAFSAGHDLLEFAGGGEWRPWRLPAMIGMSDAMRLLLSGEFIDAAEALRIGLVSEWPRQGSSCRPPTSSPNASPPTARWRSA